MSLTKHRVTLISGQSSSVVLLRLTNLIDDGHCARMEAFETARVLNRLLYSLEVMRATYDSCVRITPLALSSATN